MSLIVVGVDGSDQSRRALMWALQYAIGQDATVQAVMAVNTKDLGRAEREARLGEAERILSSTVARTVAACPHAPAVTYEVVEGEPTVVLVDASYRADLVVFGSHPMASLRNPALSTVSLTCIRLGGCPVLVIPPAAPEPAACADLVPA